MNTLGLIMESMPILNNWEIFSRKICTQFQAFSIRSPSSTFKKDRGQARKIKKILSESRRVV